jgi:ribose transport system permease protein
VNVRSAVIAALRSRVRGSLAPALRRICCALALLVAICAVAAPGTLRGSALLSMLPFAALLAIAAAGQTVVAQHAGLDLSVAATISLAAAIITKGSQALGGLAAALVLVLAAALAIGLLNGLLVARVGITPLIATIGVNALVTGAVLKLTGGVVTSAPQALSDLALKRTVGVPNTVVVAALVLAVGEVLLRFTVLGRRHVATGVNAIAARNAGLRVDTFRVAPYVVAALCFALTGTLIAGFQQSPGVAVGNSYLIPTIAVVVLAGTPLSGGRATLLATALAALFLTQLDQLVLSLGAPTAVQYLTQGAVIAIGVAAWQLSVLQEASTRLRASLRRRRRTPSSTLTSSSFTEGGGGSS